MDDVSSQQVLSRPVLLEPKHPEAEPDQTESIEPKSEQPIGELIELELKQPIGELIELELKQPIGELIEPESEQPAEEQVELEPEQSIEEQVEPTSIEPEPEQSIEEQVEPTSIEPEPEQSTEELVESGSSEMEQLSDEEVEAEPQESQLPQVEDTIVSSIDTPLLVPEKPEVEHSGEEELDSEEPALVIENLDPVEVTQSIDEEKQTNSDQLASEPTEIELVNPAISELEDMPTLQVPKADLKAIKQKQLEEEPALQVSTIDSEEVQQAELEDMPTLQVSKADLAEVQQAGLEDMPTLQVPKADLEAIKQKQLEEEPTLLIPKEEAMAVKPSGRYRLAANLPILAKPMLPKPVFLDSALQVSRTARARMAINSRSSTRLTFIVVGIAMLIILGFSGVFGSFILTSINNAGVGVQREQEVSLVISNYYQSIEQQEYGQASDYIDTQHFQCNGKLLPLDQFYAQAQALDQQQGTVVDTSIDSRSSFSADGAQSFQMTVTRQKGNPYSVHLIVKEISPNNLLIVSVSSL